MTNGTKQRKNEIIIIIIIMKNYIVLRKVEE